MDTQTITYYLEMTYPSELRPSRKNGVALDVRRVEIVCPAFNRFFYTQVGQNWAWIDRLPWSEEQWLAYLCQPGMETWVGYVAGTPAGYFELLRQDESHVELAYFGLLPQFIGQGVGGQLLTAAIQRAWEMQAARVWVHTCSKDHPNALANYTARGFRVYKTEIS